jgi:prepilin-type N-terminal cleavage/methylation domain-containing protein
MKKNLNNGFTLIELVIIMVILGVLAAVAVPRLGNTIDSSEKSTEDAVIGSLKSAVEVYAMDQVVNNSNKSYPSSPFDGLDDKSKNDLFSKGWNYDGSSISHIRNDNSSVFWSFNSTTGEISFSGNDNGNSGPVYVNHDWCASYCYDLNQYGSFENIPNGWWPPEYPVQECDCSQ